MYEIYERLRNERGITDAEVSRQTGIAQATLSNWKANIYKPKIDKIAKLAEFFGVPVETFFKN